MAQSAFIIENCANVHPFYLSSNSGAPRRQLFYDDKGNSKGALSVSRDSFVNLDDKDGAKIEGILIHVPANGFQYVVTKECPVMRSSTYTWLFPNAEPELEGKQDDATGKPADSGYHCFGITLPSDVDSKILDTLNETFNNFCDDYREANCEVLTGDEIGAGNINAASSLKELMEATSALSKTLMNKTTTTINSELAKRPELAAKLEKSKEYAKKTKDKITEKLKESGIKDKFIKATRRLSKESKQLKDDLKQGNTDNVSSTIDKGTENTVEFIRLVTRKGAKQIQSIKTVLIQRMPEYDMADNNQNNNQNNNNNNANINDTDAKATEMEPTQAGSNANGANGGNASNAPKTVDPSVMQGLEKAKQGTAFVGQVGQSVVKAVAIGAGSAVKSIGNQVEKNDAIQQHIARNPITYGNIKVIGKKTLNSYVTIANELENAALYLFSESAHATADVVEAKHGQSVGKAAHDTADVAVNIVSIFRLDNELLYGTIQEATADDPNANNNNNNGGNNQGNQNQNQGGGGNLASGYNPNSLAQQAQGNAAVQAAVGQAVMASLLTNNNANNNTNKYG